MGSLFVYGTVLTIAVLISALTHRTVLSTALLFLAAGFLAGNGVLGLIALSAGDPFTNRLVEVTLVVVLFTDGMRAQPGELRRTWRLPGRALGLGLPLTLVLVAVLARWLAGLSWLEALLVGAALSATDPVLAASFVGQEDVPVRVRDLINVESGLNDGLALPIVLVLLSVLARGRAHLLLLLGEVGLGMLLGVALPWALIALERTRLFEAAPTYQPLLGAAILILLYAGSALTHANPFLAAFGGGVTVATAAPQIGRAFAAIGEPLAEMLKLGALLVFGALISPAFLAAIPLAGYAFALLVLLLARPLALAVALAGTALNRREWIAVAWFGPKGFASVLYGLLIFDSSLEHRDAMFHLIALVVIASISAHSSTDVVVARWFRPEAPARSP